MRIGIACDHAGFPLKAPVVRALTADGHAITDFGTGSTEPVDYPDYARILGRAVRDGAVEVGILLCGSGAGAAIAANKLHGVRAALCHDLFTARQSREDDDANVLCMGARVIDADTAVPLAQAFVAARFSGAERHVRRVGKIAGLEAAECGVGPPAGAAGEPRVSVPAVDRALARLTQLDAGRRLWAQDASLWADDPTVRASVKNRLAWLTAPESMRRHLADLATFAAGVRRDGITHTVLLGMGGSSLAPEVLAQTFGPAAGAPALSVLDTTDPETIRATLAKLTLRRTLFIVASKSGTTTESNALYKFFRAEIERPEAKVPEPGAHFVAITDSGTPLEKLASSARFRRTFVNDSGIGGRYSALSFFGLVPGALLGLDLERLLASASAMAQRCGAAVPVADNPGLALGATLGGLAQAGRDKVTLVMSEPIRSLGAWLEQLITESTGKRGKGLVVVNDEPLGPPATYGDDRVFVALALAGDRAAGARLDALQAAGHPVVRIVLDEAYALGAEFFRWEVATAAAGIVLELNPFDEPNVAQAKEATQAALATFRDTGQLPSWPANGVDDVAAMLAEARPGDYVGLLAYLTPAAETTAALQALRTLVRDRMRLATTVGYGPRYLHSTGQLHKGGPPTPILVILTAENPNDLPIPGDPYSFGTLKMAQALGDLATLRAAQRRALWLPLEGQAPAAIARMTDALGTRLGARRTS
ncbi:MAG TPA: ribose 5-phosphate isomerase B [Methylomirabilota bacterium]|jgi:RpiB/LacA/LacB family sugar-phosphate isomerase|nr:ribose 5-phosphate isomerase B [Methylomirabilota bacterium]